MTPSDFFSWDAGAKALRDIPPGVQLERNLKPNKRSPLTKGNVKTAAGNANYRASVRIMVFSGSSLRPLADTELIFVSEYFFHVTRREKHVNRSSNRVRVVETSTLCDPVSS